MTTAYEKYEDVTGNKDAFINQIKCHPDFSESLNMIVCEPSIFYAASDELKSGTVSFEHQCTGHIHRATELDPARKRAAYVLYHNSTTMPYSKAKELAAFDIESALDLSSLYHIAEKLDDKFFILAYMKQYARNGIITHTKPHIFVADIVEDTEYMDVTYADGVFSSHPSGHHKRVYQLSDISDMLTVGDEIVIGDNAREELSNEQTKAWCDRHVNCLLRSDGIPNLDLYHLYYLDAEVAEYVAEKLNAIPKMRMRVCRQCHSSFLLSESEMQWYADKGFKLPNRCGVCRSDEKRRRREAEREEYFRDLLF